MSNALQTELPFKSLQALSDHRARMDSTLLDVSDPAIPVVGARGLMVRDPYATQLLSGEKKWEIRSRGTQVRGPIVVLKSGTGQAFGTVNLMRVLGPLDIEDLVDAPELPASEREEFRRDGLPYAATYAYVLSDPKPFVEPIPYSHPSGAVTWVRLPSMDIAQAAYQSG
ncbi:MAG: ASCH domain-containing protein [Hyphomonadaceae bacterium]|nr:ASCH domain-containing protein [Hyphomonadaceae bacterium]